MPVLLCSSLLGVFSSCGSGSAIISSSAGTSKDSLLQVDLAQADRFGNVYLVNSQNEITKYDADDKWFGYYSNNTLGDIGSVDVTNPLKVMAFYPAFYTSIFMDRQLRETSRIDFLDLGLGEVRTVAVGNDGTLWIFDYNQQLLRSVNQKGEILLETTDLRLLFNKTLDVLRMKQWGDELYVLTRANGLMVFDLFGLYQRNITHDQLIDFHWMGDHLFLASQEGVRRHEPVGFEGDLRLDLKVFRPSDQRLLFSRGQLIRVDSLGYKRESMPALIR